MARQLKPQQVDEVRHARLGVAVPVMLDRNTLDFFVVVNGAEYRAPTAEQIKGDAYWLIDEGGVVVWHPVIEVAVRGDDGSGYDTPRAGLDLTADRFYLGRTADGQSLRVSWEHGEREPGERMARARALTVWSYPDAGAGHLVDFATLPALRRERVFGHLGSAERTTYYLAYTDALWAALGAIAQRIHDTRALLAQLLGTDEGRAHVQTLGAALLPLVLPRPGALAPGDVDLYCEACACDQTGPRGQDVCRHCGRAGRLRVLPAALSARVLNADDADPGAGA